MMRVGLEVFLNSELPKDLGERVGFLSNHACTDRNFIHGKDLIQQKLGAQLTCLFSPQHGYFSDKQDNMIETDHSIDEKTGLKVYSLYGEHRKPTKEMFDQLDTLLIDLIDVGTRVYTFMYTMAYCLEAAAEYGKKIVILDRPNPIGGTEIEGNILRTDVKSFVGLYPMPMRHGLTLGELALFFNKEFKINADLRIIKTEGWRREKYFREIDFPWIAPSPNMPTPESAVNYPGQVIWEGTSVSEGRGTTLPFEIFGAPYIVHDDIGKFLEKQKYNIPGAVLRPLAFEPTSGKWACQTCYGFHIHVTNKKSYLPYRTALMLLQAIMLTYPDQFSYKEPPYEYEYEKLPLDLILGDSELRKSIEKGKSIIDLENDWQAELAEYDIVRRKYFLY